MLKLTRGIQRIHVDRDKARAQHGGHGNWILQHVGHHQRDAITLLQTEALQIRSERAGIGVDFAVRQRLAHAGEGRA